MRGGEIIRAFLPASPLAATAGIEIVACHCEVEVTAGPNVVAKGLVTYKLG